MKQLFEKLFGKMNNKGQLAGATNIAIGLVTLVLIVAVGAIVLGDFQSTTTANSAEFNITGDGLTGLTNMSGQFGTVGTVAIAAVLIALVVGAFVVGRR